MINLYAFELCGLGAPGDNYKGVKEVWGIVRQEELPENVTTTVPVRVPTPQELKKAFSREWSANHGWCLMKWLGGLVAAYDGFIFGLRSREDMDRVKKSTSHQQDWANGWQCTSMLGGRAKLCGTKRNSRPWKVWRVCFCPGKKHIRPPARFCEEVDLSGNARVEVKWCTLCPLAALEFMWQHQGRPSAQGRPRCYAKWLPTGRYGKSNVSDVAGLAIDWLVSQGATTNRYDSNSGRKSLSRWTRHLNIPYEESFQTGVL